MLKKMALVGVLVLGLFGCQKQEVAVEQRQQVLRLSMCDDPVSLDPREVRSLKDLTLVKQLYEGLVRVDSTGKPCLALAEKVVVSEDLLTYTFTLREATWNDGSSITANDFVRSWKELLSKEFACDYAYMLAPIAGVDDEGALGVQALDKNTLEITLKAPLPYFLELLAFPTFFPVKEQLTCGPFNLKEWKRGAGVILAKNPTYWDAAAVELDEILFSVLPDNNTETLLFEKGELDWLGQPLSSSLPPELIGALKKEGRLRSYPVAGTFWFSFNVKKYPFTNTKIRKAFALALHRQEIIDHILQGNQTPAFSPIPPTMGLGGEGSFQDGDVALAKKYLKEGLEELGVSELDAITLRFHASERNKKIVQLVKEEWEKGLGVKVHLEGSERGYYRRKLKEGDYQVGTGQWVADFNDPIAFLELFAHLYDDENGSGMNPTNWHNDTYTNLLTHSYKESDPRKREALLKEAEEVLLQAMPIAPVYHYSFDYIKKPFVKRVVLSPLGLADFKPARIR